MTLVMYSQVHAISYTITLKKSTASLIIFTQWPFSSDITLRAGSSNADVKWLHFSGFQLV